MEQALVTKLADLADPSYYQNLVKDILALAQKKGASQAEVATHVAQGLSLTMRKQEVETIEFNRGKEIGLTVYVGQKKGSASTNDLSKEALERTVDAAIHLAKYTEDDNCAGLADADSMPTKMIDCDLYHPWGLSIEEAKTLAKSAEQHALDYDKRISNTDGASLGSGQTYYVYGNSHGFIGAYPTSRHSLSCVVIAQDKAGMQRDYQYTVSRNPNDLWSAKKVGVEAAEKTLAKLSSRRVSTQSVPVIFRYDVASSLLGHFCGAISGGALYRKSSFLLDTLGKQIFHPSIQIIERPHHLEGLGSAPFDGDGVQTQDKDFIKDGVLQSYILSAYSARKLGLKNTGNAGGVHNLLIEPSDVTLETLIKNLKKAFLVTELMGQGINMVTGNYSRGAAGFWIENGEITYPVFEVTIASNLKDMFQKMSCVANDVDTRGNIQTGSVLIDEMMVAGI